jgi:hypothetical protein
MWVFIAGRITNRRREGGDALVPEDRFRLPVVRKGSFFWILPVLPGVPEMPSVLAMRANSSPLRVGGESLRRRKRKPTAVGEGIRLPHARRRGLWAKSLIALAHQRHEPAGKQRDHLRPPGVLANRVQHLIVVAAQRQHHSAAVP